MEGLKPANTEDFSTEPIARFKSQKELDKEIASQKEKEKKFDYTKRLDLFDIDGCNDEEFQALQDQLKKSDGLLRVFIHPFHVHPDYKKSERESGKIDYGEYPPVKIFADVAAHTNRPPVLLLLDEERFDIERSVYEEFGKEAGTFYVMPTLHNNGFLKLIDMEDPESRDADGSQKSLIHYGRLGMYRLNYLFSKLGVTKLLVNGSSLKVENKKISHCMGSFMLEMKHMNDFLVEGRESGIGAIKIQAGAGVVPHGRNELREEGFEQFL